MYQPLQMILDSGTFFSVESSHDKFYITQTNFLIQTFNLHGYAYGAAHVVTKS